MRFVSEQAGFVFETDQAAGATGQRGEDRARSVMAVTNDGGAHWRAETLPHPVYDCHALGGGFLCSAGAAPAPTGFNVLTVHPN